MSNFPVELALKPECDDLRRELKAIEDRIRLLERKTWEAIEATVDGPLTQNEWDRGGEMLRHQGLALGHVEDARMRIGKILQYARDGVSCFDHTKETP